MYEDFKQMNDIEKLILTLLITIVLFISFEKDE